MVLSSCSQTVLAVPAAECDIWRLGALAPGLLALTLLTLCLRQKVKTFSEGPEPKRLQNAALQNSEQQPLQLQMEAFKVTSTLKRTCHRQLV